MVGSVNHVNPKANSLVTIGRMLKPFGVHGDVKVESLSDVPGRFEGLQDVTLTSPNGLSLETTVTNIRPIPSGYIVKFGAFSTPEEASLYRGAWVQIPESKHLPREPNLYYHFELIGLRVEDPDGQCLGRVEEILDFPQHQVLVVRNEDQEVLIPASLRTIKRVDLEMKCLHLTSKEWWDLTYAL